MVVLIKGRYKAERMRTNYEVRLEDAEKRWSMGIFCTWTSDENAWIRTIPTGCVCSINYVAGRPKLHCSISFEGILLDKTTNGVALDGYCAIVGVGRILSASKTTAHFKFGLGSYTLICFKKAN